MERRLRGTVLGRSRAAFGRTHRISRSRAEEAGARRARAQPRALPQPRRDVLRLVLGARYRAALLVLFPGRSAAAGGTPGRIDRQAPLGGVLHRRGDPGTVA